MMQGAKDLIAQQKTEFVITQTPIKDVRTDQDFFDCVNETSLILNAEDFNFFKREYALSFATVEQAAYGSQIIQYILQGSASRFHKTSNF